MDETSGMKREKKAKKKNNQVSNSAKNAQKQSLHMRKDLTFNIDKSANFAEWYEEILVQAGMCMSCFQCTDIFADMVDKRYPVKGVDVYKPYGFFMQNQIMRFLADEWERQGIELVQFPLLIPFDMMNKEAEHIKGFEEECFWVTHGGSKPLDQKLALRPTSETAMYSTFALWIRSIRDLPLKVHQTCNVYRHETKDTKSLIRVREIPWNEAHTCHATEEEALENLEEAWRSYKKLLHGELGVSGLRLRRPHWDQFAGAEHSDVMDAVMPCGRVLQSIGAHYLGQKFSRVFDIKFLDEKNETQYPFMTCYGVSTRLLAAAISAHGDSKGLVLPPLIARYQVVMMVAGARKNNEAELLASAAKIETSLRDAGVRVFLDTSNKSPGDKFYYWEMKGVPLRLEVGPRDLAKAEVRCVQRDSGEKLQIHLDNVVDEINEQLELFKQRLIDRRGQDVDSLISTASNLEEMRERLDSGGFARIPYHSMGDDGKAGEAQLREEFHAEIRGFRPEEERPGEDTKCLLTGEKAKYWAYVARSY